MEKTKKSRETHLKIKSYITLSKPRIVALLVFTALVTALSTPNNTFNTAKAVKILLAGSLASSGASILNNYIDRDIDKLMNRTKNRPLTAGKIPARQALIFGLILVTLSVIIAAQINMHTAYYIAAGIITYVLIYSFWLKRRSTANIVIGGASGSFMVLAGYSAAEGTTPYLAILLALLIFLWTPPHFWALAIAYKKEYQKAGLPYLPVKYGIKKTARMMLLYTLPLIIISLMPFVTGLLGKIYITAAIIAGLILAYSNFKLFKNPTRYKALRSYKLSGMYLLCLFSAILLETVRIRTW